MPYTKPAKEQSLSGVISRRGKTTPLGTKDINNNEEHNLSNNKEETDHYQRREHHLVIQYGELISQLLVFDKLLYY